jgi:hypothetical protein
MKIEAMLWVLVLVSLALAIVSSRYRRYALLAVGVAVAAIVTVIVVASKNEVVSPPSSGAPVQRSKRVDFELLHIEKLDKEDPEARTRIAVSEIRFDQIRPSPGSDPRTIESIRARLYNDSARFSLTDFAYYLVVQDCAANACTTIYDQRGWASVTAPANQARDVTIEIRAGETRETSPFQLLGTPNIILSPTETRAYKAPTP